MKYFFHKSFRYFTLFSVHESTWILLYIYIQNDFFIDEDGKPFHAYTKMKADSKCFRVIAHKRSKRLKRKRRQQASDHYIQSAQSVTIPPESVKNVKVSTANLEDKDFHYAERRLNFQHNIEDCYGPPDSIIQTKDPFLAVTNFSKEGCPIGKHMFIPVVPIL